MKNFAQVAELLCFQDSSASYS